MTEPASPLFDWRSEWLSRHSGDHVAILFPIGGELPDENVEGFQTEIEKELRELLDQPDLAAEYIDPYTGAGGYGLAAIWEIVGRGADTFAWVSAAVVAAQQIRVAARFLQKRLGRETGTSVYLSGDALKALCVAELCQAGVDPRTIERVSLLEHKYEPVDRAIEKQQLYSAYTVVVEGVQQDEFYHVWNYFLTCRGEIISRGEARIPMPNHTQWTSVEPAAKKLDGLP